MSLAANHPETVAAVEHIYKVARRVRWHGLHEVRETFSSCDQVGSALIFDVLGGNYRLIMTVSYQRQLMHVKALLTHREYERKGWMKWA